MKANEAYDLMEILIFSMTKLYYFFQYLWNPDSIPLMTTSEGGPLLLSGHWLLDRAVVPTVPGITVTITMAAGLRQRELSVAFPPGLLPQFVPVVLDVRLLLQTNMVCLQTIHSGIEFK